MTEEKENKGGFFRRLFRREKPDEHEVRPEDKQVPLPKEPETEEPEPTAPIFEEPEFEEPLEESEEKAGFFKLQKGLTKTRKGFLGGLDEVLLGKRELDDQMVSRLEEVLVTADIGIQTAYELFDSLTDRIKRREIHDPQMVIHHLKTLMKEKLSGVEAPLRIGYGGEPFVIMVVGVNGSGKTTTIAKIAARNKAAGRKVLLAAGDTFRAAAVEQLEIWANRVGCSIVKGKEKADPSSVAFEAVELALQEDFEIVLVDTAGRLHTRVPLMDELKKVRRTLGKKLPNAPHETLLVIDASMGQNAILQAKTFNEAVPLTGIALTKLDGTAKGGVVVGMSNELKLPIRFIGVGEKMDDLREFNSGDFVEALFTGVDISEEE
jgi:fused signal recognition particle receptor